MQLIAETHSVPQFVNGSFNYSIVSPNATTVTVIAPWMITVIFNSNLPFASQVPAFFVAVSAWQNQATRTVLIGASSGQYQFVGQYVQLNVAAMCSPGFFVNIGKGLVGNTTALYDFLIPLSSSAQLCSRCTSGTFSTPDTMMLCANCTAGTFANINNTACTPCPAGMWSRAGTQRECQACTTNVTTIEQDHCVTLKFLSSPPPTVVSDVPSKIPSIALVDVFENVIVNRSGAVFAQLQCKLPGCETDLSAEFDLITTPFIQIVNGSSTATEIFFTETSQIKVGTGFTWRIVASQGPGVFVSSSINAQQSLYRVSFLGGPVSLKAVLPTQCSYAGGTLISVTSVWKLLPRILNTFANDSAVCIFRFLANVESFSATNVSYSNRTLMMSNTYREERFPAMDTPDETVKTCSTPAIPEFSYANVTVVLQDGRRSTNALRLLSVCHNNFYVNVSKCQPCPVSSTGRSTNSLINADSVETCVCSVGSYGSFGKFCRFCPIPSSLPSPPFICNSTNMLFPVVAPGYWVDYSLLPRCDALSAGCIAVTTCAFGSRACPGGGEKRCTQGETECYEGKGCSECCNMYYHENDACFKCPDSTQTTALLVIVGVVCFILAVLMSSVSSPSFTQSSRHILFGCVVMGRLNAFLQSSISS